MNMQRYVSTPPAIMPTVPRLVAEVFEHINFTGRRGWVIKPVKFTGEIGFQDNISSCIIYKGPDFHRAPNYKMILHEHINFQGRRLILGPGYYPNLHDVAFNFGDRVSSISFGSTIDTAGPEFGTIPLIVEVFSGPNFQGRRGLVLRDVRFCRDIGMEDVIRSFRIYKGPNYPSDGARVIFYEHPDFEGANLPVIVRPTDYRKEIQDVAILPQSFGSRISSIKIEGWASSSVFDTVEYQDEFDGTSLRRRWTWVDPNGGGSWTERQGYLVMTCQPGQDLWWGPDGRGGDMSAPRLIQRIWGNFAIETRIPVTPQLREHGGLLVWKDENAFIRLEKTSGAHAFRGDVRFERHVNKVFQLVGRAPGMQRAKHVYLRIERLGNQFTGYASMDGVRWVSCGTTNVGMGNPIFVGMHALAPGNIPATVTRFDYFRILRRRSEIGMGRFRRRRRRDEPPVPEYSEIPALNALERSRADLRRYMGMRQLL